MHKIVYDFSTPALTDAIEANLIARSLYLPLTLGGEVQGPNPLWFVTGEALPTSNGVVKAQLEPQSLDASIQDVLSPFKAQGRPLTWWVGPSTVPGDLGKHLQRHGLIHNRDMMGMAADLNALHADATPGALELEPVRTREMLSQWYQMSLLGFPISFNQAHFDALAAISLDATHPLQNYIGRLNGKIVAISSLFLGGGVAGLYNLVTHPEARGKGIGAWMTVETFEQARLRGYRIGTLQTTYPNALRLYHRLGFQVYCKIGIYRYLGQNGHN
jgi:ribosomal protein S18 acetylase RimI-like enzyme